MGDSVNSNYVIDDYEETNYVNENYVSHYQNDNSGKKIKTALIIGVLIIIAIIIYLILNSHFNSYSYYESKMVTKAREYINNTGIIVTNEMYITIDKLDIQIKQGCSELSGVIVGENDEYQPYLSCEKYETKFLNTDTFYRLNGKEVVLLAPGIKYNDEGVSGHSDVTPIGNIGTEEGIYDIYYTNDTIGSLQRKIIIIDNNNVRDMYPQMTLIGDAIVYIKTSDKYEDKGVNVFDSIDYDINDKVKIDNQVNEKKEGEYVVNYSVTNSRGYSTSLQRRVIVTKDFSKTLAISYVEPFALTNNDVDIILSINGDKYQYTILPDDTISNSKNIKYKVYNNDTYTFTIVENDGTRINRSVIVKNIDRDKPSGVCRAVMYSKYVDIYAIPSSMKNKKISGYNYVIDNYETGYINTQQYRYTTNNAKNISVIIKDSTGNTTKVLCDVDDNKTNLNENGITEIIGKNALDKPISEALGNRGYSIDDLNKCIYNRVEQAGPGTRYGVAASAFGLIDCLKDMTGYTLPYDHTGGKVEGSGSSQSYCSFNSDICGKLGVNSRWGKPGGTGASGSSRYGLNCANFVHWAMCNGGMDMCSKGAAGAISMSSKTYFPEGNAFLIEGNNAIYEYGIDLTRSYTVNELIHMAKPGDVLYSADWSDSSSTQHVMIIIGYDNNGLYVAENGQDTRKISYSSITGKDKHYKFVLLDNYYANTNNQNRFYN